MLRWGQACSVAYISVFGQNCPNTGAAAVQTLLRFTRPSLSLSLSPSVFGQLYQWFPCLLEEVLVDPPEELLLRELEVVPRRGVEEDLARLVGGAEAEGIRLVPRGIIDLVEKSRVEKVE